MKQATAEQITKLLTETYPGLCNLNYTTPYELCVATILSAQCTDKRVNTVTEELFAIADNPEDMLKLGSERLEQLTHSCGLYRAKTKNILSMSRALLERYNGSVPDNFDELTSLAGVGMKTAKVVLSNAFHQDYIAVDTHVFRVCSRLGLTNEKTAEKCSEALEKIIPEGKKAALHHSIIRLGREICKAGKPQCDSCPAVFLCEYKAKNRSGIK